MSGRAVRARESTQLAVAIILVSNHKCTTASVVVALHMCANVVLMVPSVLHRHRAHSAVSRDLESPDNKGCVGDDFDPTSREKAHLGIMHLPAERKDPITRTAHAGRVRDRAYMCSLVHPSHFLIGPP